MNPDTPLILAAAHLSAAAPRDWDSFLEQLKAYADRRRDDMLRAPPDQIYQAQGAARDAAQLYELMRTCRTTAEKIQTKGR